MDLHGLGGDRRRHVVPVRAAVGAEPRHGQPQHVEHLAHRADRAARPGHGRALAQGEGGRQVVDAVGVGPLGLGEPPPAVRAQALEEAVQALGVERAHGQRRLARAGHPGDHDRAPERHVHVEVAQRVVPDAARLDGPRQRVRRRRNLGDRHDCSS
jgi:hypothetical protein